MEHASTGLVILIVPAIQDTVEHCVKLRSIIVLPELADQIPLVPAHVYMVLAIMESAPLPALVAWVILEHYAKHKLIIALPKQVDQIPLIPVHVSMVYVLMESVLTLADVA
jgi:hypothetical protein